MPIWISLLEMAVKVLVWIYGHPAVAEKLSHYEPLPPDPLPSPKEQQGPIEPHYGG